MWKYSTQMATLIVLSGIVAMVAIACNRDDSASVPSQSIATTPAASPSPRPVALSVKATPKPSALLVKPSPINSEAYDRAMDIAMGAVTISKSAVSRQDWTLVASQWQQAINLLKTVPTASTQHKQAQTKVAQYQRFLAEAKEKATPPAKTNQPSDITPQYFSVPIKGRIRGTPIIEVSFNSTRKFDMLFDTGANITLITRMIADSLKLKPLGLTKIAVADGAQVLVYQTALKSIEIDGRIKRNMQVVIAPPAMPVGLLGQDFYEGYDISIKQDIIEFRRHAGS
jgi:predicted aspartyl protease